MQASFTKRNVRLVQPKEVRTTTTNGQTTIHIGSSPHSLSSLIDAEGHNVLTKCIFVKESIRCSKELAAIFKDSFEDAPYNGPFV